MLEIPSEQLWKYLSIKQLEQLENSNLKSENIIRRTNMIRCIINPLYMYAIRNGFDDTELMKAQTINDMFYELGKFYHLKQFTRDDIEELIKGPKQKK